MLFEVAGPGGARGAAFFACGFASAPGRSGTVPVGPMPPTAAQVRHRQPRGPGVLAGTVSPLAGTGGSAPPAPQGQARAPPLRLGSH
eukprot:4794699-Alexandrium_andersonii.AAC.1